MNKNERLVTINENKIMMYNWADGVISREAPKKITLNPENEEGVYQQRVYMTLLPISLPANSKIKKAELKLLAESITMGGESSCKIGLYGVTGNITEGVCTPKHSENLLDYECVPLGAEAPYELKFDITRLAAGIVNKSDGGANIMLRALLADSASELIFGENVSLELVCETDYAHTATDGANTHTIGRFGEGAIDAYSGKLEFLSQDFAWGGCRMPVSISHSYCSALADCQYTTNDVIGLNVADFSGMRLGLGWRLDLMQSMVHYYDDGDYFVHTDENGNQTHFKLSEKTVKLDTTQNVEYHLFEDTDGNEIYYDECKKILTDGDTNYHFCDERLVKISDKYNEMSIGYTDGVITTVTDGAGRCFDFAYDTDGYLVSITAPDGTKRTYDYTNRLLTSITNPDGTKVNLEYNERNRPQFVTLEKDEVALYRVEYTFDGDRVIGVCEYEAQGEEFVTGATSSYTYDTLANMTTVTSTVPMDESEGETEDTVITTVYSFDNDGAVVSQYTYGSNDVKGEATLGAGINPEASITGGESNVNNMLANHSFSDTSGWTVSGGTAKVVSDETLCKYGKTMLSFYADSTEATVCQDTIELPAGEYAFSAYVKVNSCGTLQQEGDLHLAVLLGDGSILAESECLGKVTSDFVRLCVPFITESEQSVRVAVCVSGGGSVDIHAPQLENNACANNYNMLENSNFENGINGWGGSANIAVVDDEKFNMQHSLRLVGNFDSETRATQQVAVKQAQTTRESFTLSGWGKAFGLAARERTNCETPQFNISAVIHYTGGEIEAHTAEFVPSTDSWQPAEVSFAKEKFLEIDYITVECNYSFNSGYAYFDDIRLFRTDIETDLTADDFDSEDDEIAVASEIEDTETEAETPEFEEAVDIYGNTITSTTFAEGEFGTIYGSYNYIGEKTETIGNDLVCETDSRGFKTYYTVDPDTSRNTAVTDRCGNRTEYEYDTEGKVTKVTSKNASGIETANVRYRYDSFGNMTRIARGDDMRYLLAYNGYHKLESIGVGGKALPLVSYKYKNGSGRIKEITYATGFSTKITYNDKGQIMSENLCDEFGDINTYRYSYDSAGNMVRALDTLDGLEYNYTYENGVLTRSSVVAASVLPKVPLSSVDYIYDNSGSLCKKVVFDGENTIVYTTEQGENENTTVSVEINGNTVKSKSETDALGRKIYDELNTGNGFVSHEFSYLAGKETDEHAQNDKLVSGPTTQLVSQITLSGGRTISYEYDAEERITKVIDSVDGVTEYTYDSLGQLLTETKNGELVNRMLYDNYGNILCKNDIDYIYGDVVWRDLLTAVGDKTITYDAQGNPTNYLGKQLIWKKGRQLAWFEGCSFNYNIQGIRTLKRANGIDHHYTLDGTKILKETFDNNTIIPLYDSEENVCGIIYNDTPFYFQKNLQGDVIAITDQNADTVARYSYDAWGVPTIVCDNSTCQIAEINPFRYRGYYFDQEIGLYYLQSRYYDPSVGRFINGDIADYVSIVYKCLITNLFAYCSNEPILGVDPTGCSGFRDIWNAIKGSFDFIKSIADQAYYACEKTVPIKKIKKLSKETGKSQRQIMRELKKLAEDSERCFKKFKIAETVFAVLSVVIFAVSYLKNGKKLFYDVYALIVDLFIEAASWIICKIAEVACKPIPGFGFLLGFAVSLTIGFIIDEFFTSNKKKKMTNAYQKKMKNNKKWYDWIFNLLTCVSAAF